MGSRVDVCLGAVCLLVFGLYALLGFAMFVFPPVSTQDIRAPQQNKAETLGPPPRLETIENEAGGWNHTLMLSEIISIGAGDSAEPPPVEINVEETENGRHITIILHESMSLVFGAVLAAPIGVPAYWLPEAAYWNLYRFGSVRRKNRELERRYLVWNIRKMERDRGLSHFIQLADKLIGKKRGWSRRKVVCLPDYVAMDPFFLAT